MKLKEGLRRGDLDGLVGNTISVDEYESKISDDGLVVGISVEDKEPAQDLSRFIEKSATELLDSEISPGPDENGNYWVFVEFMRDEGFADKLINLLKDVERVCDVRSWFMKIYHKELSYKVDKENIIKYVRLEDATERKKAQKELGEYMAKSYANSVELYENSLAIDGKVYSIEGFGDADNLYRAFGLHFKPIRLDEAARLNTRPLERSLGPGWYINQIDEYILCQIEDSDKILILKD